MAKQTKRYDKVIDVTYKVHEAMLAVMELPKGKYTAEELWFLNDMVAKAKAIIEEATDRTFPPLDLSAVGGVTYYKPKGE